MRATGGKKGMRHESVGGGNRESGFSLIELMIALVVTVIVSGAVFGLIATGNNSFRREPELTDRQQNIRIAMERITKDVATAGVDMSPWAQVFSESDAGTPLDGAGPLAPSGARSDFLEVFGSSGECPLMPVDQIDGVNVILFADPPRCYEPFPILVHFSWTTPPGTRPGFACDPAAGGGGGTGHLNFPPGQAPGVNWPGGTSLPPSEAPPSKKVLPGTVVGKLEVARYEIAPDPTDGVLSLWRSNTGRAPADGGCGVGGGGAGGGAGVPGTGVDWRMIARGIEDLQVRYVMADGAGPIGTPDLVLPNDYTTLVREVQIDLVARVMKRDLQGETNAAPGSGRGAYVRASLTSTVTPRTMLGTLRGAPTGGPVDPWK